MGTYTRVTAELSVGTHDTLSNVMASGLGLEYGLGVSQGLVGSHGNSKELGGTRGSSLEQKKTTRGLTREPTETALPTWEHTGILTTWW